MVLKSSACLSGSTEEESIISEETLISNGKISQKIESTLEWEPFFNWMNTLRNIEVEWETIIIRADLNVPIDKNWNITDDAKVRWLLPTLEYLVKKWAKRIIILSHFGRPEMPEDFPKNSLLRVNTYLNEKLNINSTFVENHKNLKGLYQDWNWTEIFLLENTRFDPREKWSDAEKKEYAEELKNYSGATKYINDAYGSIQNKDSSVLTLANCFDYENKSIWLLMEKELRAIQDFLDIIKDWWATLIIGWAKKDKIERVERMPNNITVIVSWALAHAFLVAKKLISNNKEDEWYLLDKKQRELLISKTVWNSLCIEWDVEKAIRMLKSWRKIILPEDFVVIIRIDNDGNVFTKEFTEIPEWTTCIDIWTKTLQQIKQVCNESKVILVNWTTGNYEITKQWTEWLLEILMGAEAKIIAWWWDCAAAMRQSIEILKNNPNLNLEETNAIVSKICLSTWWWALLELIAENWKTKTQIALWRKYPE